MSVIHQYKPLVGDSSAEDVLQERPELRIRELPHHHLPRRLRVSLRGRAQQRRLMDTQPDAQILQGITQFYD